MKAHKNDLSITCLLNIFTYGKLHHQEIYQRPRIRAMSFAGTLYPQLSFCSLVPALYSRIGSIIPPFFRLLSFPSILSTLGSYWLKIPWSLFLPLSRPRKESLSFFNSRLAVISPSRVTVRGKHFRIVVTRCQLCFFSVLETWNTIPHCLAGGRRKALTKTLWH